MANGLGQGGGRVVCSNRSVRQQQQQAWEDETAESAAFLGEFNVPNATNLQAIKANTQKKTAYKETGLYILA